ncbi:Methylated-DNA--protein-cysteine methyltransferase [Minicystis rosea]|nr:Methylated-DNA--protein-cysteine methyltransferase [Minicystis rosea]
MSTMYETHVQSPLGALHLVASEDALLGVYLPGHKGAPSIEARELGSLPVLVAAKAQLEAYFAGDRDHFDLPLDMRGSPFQRLVWKALADIPFGDTRSYADLARLLERPLAARAVGAANARNPISIIVPCHRVIAGNGALTGYAGGIEAKRWLLAHERRRGVSTARSREIACASGA